MRIYLGATFSLAFITLIPIVSFAALTPPTSINQQASGCTTSSGKIITFYVPHNAPNCRTSMEGCVETSKKGLDGINKPRCLDDVRNGAAKFVTLASDASNYGRYFCLGNISYTSGIDGKKYTVPNVVGYVHDTGGAFKGRPDKLDVCATICERCTDAQAGALASGKNIGYIPTASGNPDFASSIFGQSGFNSVLTGQNNPMATLFGGGQTSPPSFGSGGVSSSGQQTAQNMQYLNDGYSPRDTFQVTATNQSSVLPESFEESVAEIVCEDKRVSWKCPEDTRARGLSKPYDKTYITKGLLEGTATVAPKILTQYTIQCLRNQRVIAHASCAMGKKTQVNTKNKPPVLSVEVEPQSVLSGQRVTVTWAALSVRSCALSGPNTYDTRVSGSLESYNLNVTDSNMFVLECIGHDGRRVRKDVTVSVE